MRKVIFILACFIVCSMQGYSQNTGQVQQSKEKKGQSKDEDVKSKLDEVVGGVKYDIGAVEKVRPENRENIKNSYVYGGVFKPVLPSNFKKVPLARFLKPDGKIIFDALSQEEKNYYVGLAQFELGKAENKKKAVTVTATKAIGDKLSKAIKENLGIELTEDSPDKMLKKNDPNYLELWLGRKYSEKSGGNLPSNEAINRVMGVYNKLTPLYKNKKDTVDNSEVGKELARLQEINKKLREWCPACGK